MHRRRTGLAVRQPRVDERRISTGPLSAFGCVDEIGRQASGYCEGVEGVFEVLFALGGGWVGQRVGVFVLA